MLARGCDRTAAKNPRTGFGEPIWRVNRLATSVPETMSQSQTRTLGTVTQRDNHRRDNFWGNDEQDDDDVEDGHDQTSTTMSDAKAEHIAKEELKKGATFLSPRALQQPDEYDLHPYPTAVEMTDPCLNVREHDGQLETSYGLYPRRYDDYGNISTGKIANREHSRFMAIVERIVDSWIQRGKIRHAEKGEVGEPNTLLSEADRQKRLGQSDDYEIVAMLAKAREWPNGVADYFEN